MAIRTLGQQSAAMSAWRPFLASSKGNRASFGISVRCDPQRARIQRWIKSTPLCGKCVTLNLESLQWSRNLRQSGRQKRTRLLVSPVLNAQPPTSEENLTAEELKAQLESLQQEASQVRDRYDSSRARFMRLAQVAEQLQQRAVYDLKLGNEGNARQLLIEKKKVMSAAESSKRRSEIYELLSSKLIEAISQKETQLMSALTSMPAAKTTGSQEPIVRVIFPREDSPLLHEEVLEQELEDIFCFGVDGRAPSRTPEKPGNGISPVSVRAKRGAERDGNPDEGSPGPTFTAPGFSDVSKHGSIFEERDGASTAWAEDSASEPSEEEIYSEDELESQLSDELGSATKNLGTDVLCLQEELDTPVADADLKGKLESSSTDEVEGTHGSRSTRMDVLDLHEEEAETKTAMNKGHEKSHVEEEGKTERKVDMRLVFEEYLLDIDSQVAGLELKLQSFLVTANILFGSNSEMPDERVVLVKTLLQKIQGLRTRYLSQGVLELTRPIGHGSCCFLARILESVNKSLDQQSE